MNEGDVAPGGVIAWKLLHSIHSVSFDPLRDVVWSELVPVGK